MTNGTAARSECCVCLPSPSRVSDSEIQTWTCRPVSLVASHPQDYPSRMAVRAGAALTMLLASALLQASHVLALSIELKDVAPDRIDRQRAAAVGRLPLPGTPDVTQTERRLAEKGFKSGAAVMIRIFKSESELELWMERDGRFELFATYPICHWSGTLGPKLQEGDKQTPEGFYTITSRQLHRIGRWPRSLNLGFPNAYDRALGRSGSYILVHGGCSSVGCFAMTNPVIAEIYALTYEALRAGQSHVPTHVFPFRMTEENLTKHRSNPWAEFWANLKEGYDSFERTRRPPRISVCEDRYHIQDAAGPVEAGISSPLAVCGGTAAAISALDKSVSLVPLNPPLPSPSPLRLRMHLSSEAQSAALPPTRDHFEIVADLAPQRAPHAPTTKEAKLPKISCNLGLPSCRKFMALKARRNAALSVAGRGDLRQNIALNRR